MYYHLVIGGSFPEVDGIHFDPGVEVDVATELEDRLPRLCLRVRMEPAAALDELEAARGRQAEDPAALGAVRRRHDDGDGLVEQGLVAALGVDVH